MGTGHIATIVITLILISHDAVAHKRKNHHHDKMPCPKNGEIPLIHVNKYEGEIVTMRCRTHGHFNPQVSWFYGDNNPEALVTQSQGCDNCYGYPLSMGRKTITLMAMKESQGVYSCKATDRTCGTMETYFLLSVKAKQKEVPKVSISYRRQPLHVGDKISIVCDITKMLHVQVKWYQYTGYAPDGNTYWHKVGRDRGVEQKIYKPEIKSDSSYSSDDEDDDDDDIYISGQGSSQEYGGTASEEQDDDPSPIRYRQVKDHYDSSSEMDGWSSSESSQQEDASITKAVLTLYNVQPEQTAMYACVVSSLSSTWQMYNMSSVLTIQQRYNPYISVEVKSRRKLDPPRVSEPLLTRDEYMESKDEYLRGIFIAVVVSCVIVVGGTVGFCVIGITKAKERQDTFLI